ncbi:MAG: hypothetical protein Q8N53_03110 [Longimicrobiales bacterium]|nr:hypothetical protein [Longimicrobiales bacterium]
MTEIVKGWAEHTAPWRECEGARVILHHLPKHISSVPVLLVPDDGSYRVVTAEEWRCMEQMARTIWQGVPHVVLGEPTEGGGK